MDRLLIELTREELLWLETAARRGAQDTIVPGAADELLNLADRLKAAAQP